MADANVLHMQQQAAQRVQRMAERSRRLVREQPVNIYRGVTTTPMPPRPEAPKPEVPCHEPPKPEVPCHEPAVVCRPHQTVTRPRADKGLLSFLEGDQERVLLLLLILMLGKNGAPAELLLALLYIAL